MKQSGRLLEEFFSLLSLSLTHTNTHRVTHCLLCFCLSHRNPHRGGIYVKDPTLLLSSHPFSFPLYISSSNIEVSEKQRLCSKEAPTKLKQQQRKTRSHIHFKRIFSFILFLFWTLSVSFSSSSCCSFLFSSCILR